MLRLLCVICVLVLAGASADTCSWSLFAGACPVSSGGAAVCGLSCTGNLCQVCTYCSAWIWGCSVDADRQLPGTIQSINMIQQTGNCGQGSGVGSSQFRAHCGCEGDCKFSACWNVVLATSADSAPPLDALRNDQQ